MFWGFQEPDPFVRGMDPGIRIRPKMSRIPNTGSREPGCSPVMLESFHHIRQWSCNGVYATCNSNITGSMELIIPTLMFPTHLIFSSTGSCNFFQALCPRSDQCLLRHNGKICSCSEVKLRNIYFKKLLPSH